jgi:hypothetical protein
LLTLRSSGGDGRPAVSEASWLRRCECAGESCAATQAVVTRTRSTGTPFSGSLAGIAASGFTSLKSLIINGASLSGTLPAALVPALNGLSTCALTSNGLACPLPAGLTKLSCNPASCVVAG